MQTVIAINIAIFLIGQIRLDDSTLLEWIFNLYGARWPVTSSNFRPWQFLSAIFLHSGFYHLFFNMLGLYWFGTELEDIWGWRKFLLFYLICGVGANLIDAVVLDLGMRDTPYYALGASGAIYGLLAAFGYLFPRRKVYMMFFFPMPARTAVVVYALFELYAGFARFDNIGHFAHLGGAVIGFLLVRFGWRTYSRFQFSKPTHPSDPPPAPDETEKSDAPPVAAPAPRESPAPFTMEHDGASVEVSRELLDALLDRLQGGTVRYGDLSEIEKAIVAEAARRTARPAESQ